MRMIRDYFILMVLAWSLVLLPTQALAQTGSLSCNTGTGSVQSGEIYDTASVCQYQGINHIFSMAVCKFVQVINGVLSSVYCGMQYTLATMIGAIFTIYIAVFGAQMLMGTVNLSAKEFLVRILKVAIIWIFITQATWGISIAFSFFISLANEGIGWVMSAIPWSSALSPDSANSTCYDASASSAAGPMAAFTRLDNIICSVVTGPFTQANNKVVGFLTALSFAVPPIGVLIISWLWLNLKVMVNGLITFLLGIAAIAFLIAMSPIFLSLMLFKATYNYFETWLKFMISFSLQIIIVFACIALWMIATASVIGFFNDLSTVIFPYQKVTAESAAYSTNNSWGVCPFTYTDTASGPTVTCQAAGGGSQTLPISTLLMSKTDASANVTNCINGPEQNDCSKFLYFMFYNLITLLIVCYAFESLLREAPKIAQYLAGPDYAPMLGQGFGVARGGMIRSLGSSSGSSSQSGGQSFLGSFFGGNKSGGASGANNSAAAAATQGSRPAASGTVAQTFRAQSSPLITS
jgi:type IV secretory pathway VirB6-like protein